MPLAKLRANQKNTSAASFIKSIETFHARQMARSETLVDEIGAELLGTRFGDTREAERVLQRIHAPPSYAEAMNRQCLSRNTIHASWAAARSRRRVVFATVESSFVYEAFIRVFAALKAAVAHLLSASCFRALGQGSVRRC